MTTKFFYYSQLLNQKNHIPTYFFWEGLINLWKTWNMTQKLELGGKVPLTC